MKGLRTQENDKFIRFFEMVQEQSAKQGCVFFLDCGEGCTFENDQIECENLSGWLIPTDKVDDFSKEFEKIDSDLDEWSEYIAFVKWDIESQNKNINITIKQC